MFATQLRGDVRALPAEDRRSTCRRCGARLFLLLDDRRQGFCFDCFDPSEVRTTFL